MQTPSGLAELDTQLAQQEMHPLVSPNLVRTQRRTLNWELFSLVLKNLHLHAFVDPGGKKNLWKPDCTHWKAVS